MPRFMGSKRYTPTILTLNIDAVQNWHATKAERPNPIPNRSKAKEKAPLERAVPKAKEEEVRRAADMPSRGPTQSHTDPIPTRAIIVPDTAAIPAQILTTQP
jgi:hypothetical protein